MTIANDARQLIDLAAQKKFSDLLFKPNTDGWKLLGRTVLTTHLIRQLSITDGQALINYFKFNAQMDLSEHRRPQIGAWHYRTADLTIDLRLATVGDFLNHESMVVRLLSRNANECEFINPQRYDQLQRLLSKRGLFLFAGPTGSGKTTLMYHLAQQLSTTKTVLSIEDPTEIVAPNFIQLQVNNDAQMSYGELLKISLRLRPDILIIGEIRDDQTAKMAVQAALSGHLVLATVHARTSGGVIQRMIDLGVSQTSLSNALTGCCYQRLILTTDQAMKVALDLLSPTEMASLIAHPRSKLFNWQADLQEAQQNGEITATTLAEYQDG
ncbi:competence type IV pilus ATPase ComGA [Lapidilactobacillus mulanensis]|uniref:Competence type IV pilus ATPase ComGA n=1 Tax=Lapidilactobacillus mulanensis TaxID=2485999 RepID=A0ABW4DPS5_9LACO|nr:competence type IV pilus ATPase ComGA [Lapidilactobacillus mulanensis]